MTHPAETRNVLRILWCLAIFIVVLGSLLPGTSLPMRALDHLHISDKVEHFGACAILAFLPAIHERRKVILAAAVGAVALGVALEFGQHYLGWRNFEIADMSADAVGVCFGLAAGIPTRSAKVLRPVVFSDH